MSYPHETLQQQVRRSHRTREMKMTTMQRLFATGLSLLLLLPLSPLLTGGRALADPVLCGLDRANVTWSADNSAQLLMVDNDGITRNALDLSTGTRTRVYSDDPKDLWFQGSDGTFWAAHNGWGLVDLGSVDYASLTSVPANGYLAKLPVVQGHVYAMRKDAGTQVYKLLVTTYNSGMYSNVSLQYAAGTAACQPSSATPAASPWGAPQDVTLEQADNLDGISRDGLILQTGERRPFGNQGGDLGLIAGPRLQTFIGGFVDLGAVDWNAPKTRPAKGWQNQVSLVPGHVILFQGAVVAKIQVLNVDTSSGNAVALRYSVATGNVPVAGTSTGGDQSGGGGGQGGAISGLTYAVSGGKIVLNWTAPIPAPTGGYNIYRGDHAGFTLDTTRTDFPVTGTTFTDDAVKVGQTYYYVVEAVGGGRSQEISVTVTDTPASVTHVIKLQLDSTSAVVDGQPKTLDVPPQLIGGRTMVPLRFLADALGAQISFEAATRKITYQLGNIQLVLYVDRTDASLNGNPTTLDVPPTIVGGRTLVPVRFVSENLGAKAQFDAATRSITVTYTGSSAQQSADDSAFIKAGDAALDKGDNDGAIAAYNQALAINANDADAYNGLGIAYAAKHDYVQAIANYTKALNLVSDPILYRNRGGSYYRNGDYDRAIADFTQAITLKSNYAMAYLLRGYSYEAKGDKANAIADYRKVLTLTTDSSLTQKAQKQLQALGAADTATNSSNPLVGMYANLRVPGAVYQDDSYLIISSGAAVKGALLINADGTYAWNSAWDAKIIQGRWTANADGSIVLHNAQEGKDWTVGRSTASTWGGGDIYVWDGSIWYIAERVKN